MSGPNLVIDRRTFLQIAGITAVAVIGGSAAVRASDRPIRSSALAGLDALSADPSIEVLAGSLDYDTEAIFRFVSDQIRYEPYAGVLRGASGTLSARAGNAADQALLLGALLDAALVPYRFAIGPIDRSTASALMGDAVVDGPTARADVAAAWDPIEQGRATTPTTSLDPAVRERLAQARADGPAVLAWGRRQLDADVATITSALQGAGIVVPGGYSKMPDLERQQHVWVQVSSGSEWVDMDSSTPGASVGQPLTEATSTFSVLPDTMRHRISFVVVAETLRAATLVQEPVLQVSAWADELVATPIQFLNIRPDGMKALGTSVPAALDGKKSYLPALVVGDAAYVGVRAFGFGTGGGVFDTAPGIGLGVTEGDATGEWLEITIASPGHDPVVVRRPIFDRIGLAAREGGTPDLAAVPPVEFTDLGPDLQGEYLQAQAEHWFTVSGGRLAGDAMRAAIRPADDQLAFVNFVHAYHLVRDAADLEMAVPASVHTFQDAPNIVSFSVAVSSAGVSGPMATFAVDIWHRSYGYLPVSRSSAAANPGVVTGVLSHVAERLLMGDALPRTGAQPRLPMVSVGAVFDAARADGVPIRVMNGASTQVDLDYPPEVLARVRRTLADGWLVIAPVRTVSVGGQPRTGWWQVDPATGRTADQMDDGRGEVDAYAVTLRPGQIATQSGWFREVGLCFMGGALVAAGLLDVLSGADQGGAVGLLGKIGGTGAAGFGGYLIKTCA